MTLSDNASYLAELISEGELTPQLATLVIQGKLRLDEACKLLVTSDVNDELSDIMTTYIEYAEEA